MRPSARVRIVGVPLLIVGLLLAASVVPIQASTTDPNPAADSIVDRLRPEHPRLIATDEDIATLSERVATDPDAGRWFVGLTAEAEQILTAPPSEYEIPDGKRLLETSRRVLDRTRTLGLLFRLTGDDRYAERLWDELSAAAAFPDWNPSHFLDVAEMTHAFALGYDWLYAYWSPDRRDVIRTAIVEHGLQEAADGYDSGAWWTSTTNNWNIVCNGGIAIGALAVGDEVPELAEKVLQDGLASIGTGIAEYGPDGGFPEGVGYWGYATRYLVPYLASLESAIGDDFGLGDSAGLAETGRFPVYLNGPSGQSFNFYDAGGGSMTPPDLFWLATAYDDPVLAWWGREGANNNPTARSLLWYDPESVMSPVEAGLDLDASFRNAEVATFRSAWENPNALFAGFKAGDSATSHSDLDLGTFVLDALGVRWADELGGDDYNLPGYFDYSDQRWTYYRKRAEGQNTLVVDPGSGAEQDPTAAAEITRTGSGPTEAFAIADLTAAYDDTVDSWQRGIAMLDHRRHVLVQDELIASEPVESWWFMHTAADISIAPDGRSAILTQNGERLMARLLDPTGELTLVAMDAAPLWSAPDPEGQAVNSGLSKLSIHAPATDRLTLPVLFTPLRDGEELEADPPQIEPLSEWRVGHRDVPELNGLAIDGAGLEAFVPGRFTYDVELPAGSTEPPAVDATAEPGTRVVVHQANTVPGTARIEVIRRGGPRSAYLVHFDHPDPLLPVIASGDDGNPPANTIDQNLATRWSAEGDGQWIRYDLGERRTVDGVSLAWYNGDRRASSFDIEVSDDDRTWTPVFSGTSSGETNDPERYGIEPTAARYIRVVGHGNSDNAWNSITETVVHLTDGDWPPPSTDAPVLSDVDLTVDGERIDIGHETGLSLTGTMTDGSEADLSDTSIEFVSTDPTVASVDADGHVVGLAEGTTRVAGIVTTADRRLEHATVTIRVEDPTRRTVLPTADAWARSGAYADDNYGSVSPLMVKWAGGDYHRQSFLAFDLSELTEPERIESATLHFTAAVRDSEGTEIDLHLHDVTGPWDEDALTWNTRPDIGDRFASVHVNGEAYADYTVELTEQVRRAATGSLDFAVVQDPANEVGLATRISSREAPSGHPYLRIILADG